MDVKMKYPYLSMILAGSIIFSAFSYDVVKLDYQGKELSNKTKHGKHVLNMSSPGRNYDIVEDELVVRYKNGVDKNTREAGIKEIQDEIGKIKQDTTQWSTMRTHHLLDRAISVGKKNQNIEQVDYNYIIHSQALTNDTLVDEQWYLNAINISKL